LRRVVLIVTVLAGVHAGAAARAQTGVQDMNEALRRNREAYAPYFECVKQKPAEVELYHRAQEVRQYRDIKAGLHARATRDPEAAVLEAQVDVALAAAWGNYQMAGGAAASPEAVVVPPPPCPPPIPIPREGGETPVQTQLQFRKSIRIPAPLPEPGR
jgi:hypothetical protein